MSEKITKYDKLVRNYIPDIIERTGEKIAVTRRLDDDEYKTYLKKKLVEEVEEFLESESLEELVDIQEVIYAIRLAYEFSYFDYFAKAQDKCLARGDFSDKILLMEVREKER